jgi:hypothetical protein
MKFGIRHSIGWLFVSVFPLLSGCGDGTATQPTPVADYFPHTLGSTWTYVLRDSTGHLQPDTLFVTAVKDTLVDQLPAVDFLYHGVSADPGSTQRSTRSVFEYHRLATFEDDWVCYYTTEGVLTFVRYKLPLKEGAMWDLTTPASTWHITYDVLAPVDVTVPAGDFHTCLPVRNIEHESDGPETDIEFFCDGIGLVRRLDMFSSSDEVLIAYHIE